MAPSSGAFGGGSPPSITVATPLSGAIATTAAVVSQVLGTMTGPPPGFSGPPDSGGGFSGPPTMGDPGLPQAEVHILQPKYSHATFGTLITFSVLAFVAVLTRMYTRLRIVRNPGPEDWTITASLFCALAGNAIFMAQGPISKRIQSSADIPTGISLILQLFYAAMLNYTVSLFLTKVSIMLQYLRIFPNRTTRIWLWTSFAIVIAYGFITIFSMMFTCRHIPDFWSPRIMRTGIGSCSRRLGIWYANGILNIATDLLVIILPMPMLKSLKLAKRQKLGLMIPFGLAGVVVVVSILRLHALSQIFGPTQENINTKPLIDIWSGTETCVGIICACAPVLKSFIVHYKPGFFSSTSGSGNQGPSAGSTKEMSRWPRWISSLGGGHQNSNISGSTKVDHDENVHGRKGRDVLSYTDPKSPITTHAEELKTFHPYTTATITPPHNCSQDSDKVELLHLQGVQHKHSLSSNSGTRTTSTSIASQDQAYPPSTVGTAGSQRRNQGNMSTPDAIDQEVTDRVIKFSTQPKLSLSKPLPIPRSRDGDSITGGWPDAETKSQGWA